MIYNKIVHPPSPQLALALVSSLACHRLPSTAFALIIWSPPILSSALHVLNPNLRPPRHGEWAVVVDGGGEPTKHGAAIVKVTVRAVGGCLIVGFVILPVLGSGQFANTRNTNNI
jgi:hypothetical protein